eukprot:CAMPEP_0114536406 /NCGR_PEP_ID=MMETSP0109-20121206/28985_1 /TAXON_ID=29199 /ORGANISM="Chlorarachnion reptans, Strain CCCM449" /LENGTH=170 /DNA_ID=CAMNT_0001720141 /DNA_START=1543 /DNA_END=2055 /DNA_ORIENTATION=-
MPITNFLALGSNKVGAGAGSFDMSFAPTFIASATQSRASTNPRARRFRARGTGTGKVRSGHRGASGTRRASGVPSPVRDLAREGRRDRRRDPVPRREVWASSASTFIASASGALDCEDMFFTKSIKNSWTSGVTLPVRICLAALCFRSSSRNAWLVNGLLRRRNLDSLPG